MSSDLLMFAHSSKKNRGIRRLTKGSARRQWFEKVGVDFIETVGQSIVIGRERYPTAGVSRPADADEGGRKPIPADSPLFELATSVELDGDGSGDTLRRIQQAGAEMFRRLKTSLKSLVPFYDPMFDRNLLTLATYYTCLKCGHNAGRGNCTHVGRWPSLVRRDPTVSRLMIGYLKASQDDEHALLGQLRARLLEPWPREYAQLDEGQVDRLCGALEELRFQLGRGPRIGPQSPSELVELASPANCPWLIRYPEYLEHCVPGLDQLTNPGELPDQSFSSYYRLYRSHRETADGIIRTLAIQPLFAMFLVAKCRAHGAKDLLQAAQTSYDMFFHDRAVRTPALSVETLQLDEQHGRIALDRREIAPELAGDKNFQVYRQEFRDHMFRIVLSPDNLFTREMLLTIQQRCFLLAAQLSGGKLQKILGGMEEHHQRNRQAYHRILTAETAPAALCWEGFRDVLLAGSDAQQRDVFEVVMAQVPADTPAGQLREEVRRTFVREMAVRAEDEFERQYMESRSEIEKQSKEAQANFRVRAFLNRAQGDAPGTFVTLTPGLNGDVIHDIFEPDDRRQWREAVAEAIARATPSEIKSPLPEKLAHIPPGVPLHLAYDGRVVGSLLRRDDLLVIAPTKAEDAAAIGSQRTVVTEADGTPLLDGEGEPLSLVEVRGLDAFDPLALGETDPARIVEDLEGLRRQIAAIVLRCQETDGELAAKVRLLVQLMILIDLILAAPESTVQLGRPHLGQHVALLADMVLNLDDDADPDLYVPAPSTRSTQRLSKMEIGRYYAASNAGDWFQHYQFNYALAKEVIVRGRPYLQDIDCLKRFLDGCPLDMNVANDLLSEHNRAASTASLAYCGEPRLRVFYLSRQAFRVDPVAEFAGFTSRLVQKCVDYPAFVPIFVADEIISTETTPVPVIDPRTCPLPRLRRGRLGSNDDIDATLVDLVIQDRPYLPLAASLLTEGGSYGRIAFPCNSQKHVDVGEDRSRIYWDIPDEIRDEWVKCLCVRPQNGDWLADLLRRAWTAVPPPGQSNGLFETVLSAVLVNLALKARREASGLLLQANFGELLARGLADEALVSTLTDGLPPHFAHSLSTLSVKRAGAWNPVSVTQTGVQLTDDFRVGDRPPVELRYCRRWMTEFARQLPAHA